jgi:uncharacterized protein YacL
MADAPHEHPDDLTTLEQIDQLPTYRAMNMQDEERKRQRLLLLTVRSIFLVLLVTLSLLPFIGKVTDDQASTTATLPSYIWPLIATLGVGLIVITVDTAIPNKRLASIFGIYLGVVAGLAGSIVIGRLLDLIADSWGLTSTTYNAYFGLAKVVIGVTLCYLAVSIVMTTKDDFRLVIPYVEFAKQARGVRPLLIDTSVLIDGRIEPLAQTGFLVSPLVVPQFVIDEMQTLADSRDRLKRSRGRRGLEILSRLQGLPELDLTIESSPSSGIAVDEQLLQLAREQNMRILTTDLNLNKVGQIRGVTVLNMNDLAASIRTQAIPGQTMGIEIVRAGENPGQGVGYMPDGTMVVIEDAEHLAGNEVQFVVTNVLQTSAGRMVFGKMLDDYEHEDGREGRAESDDAPRMADAATHQPRTTDRPRTSAPSRSSRNPRR